MPNFCPHRDVGPLSFSFTKVTRTEGLVKKEQRVTGPLSLKKSDAKFDVIIGENQYGGEVIPYRNNARATLKTYVYHRENREWERQP